MSTGVTVIANDATGTNVISYESSAAAVSVNLATNVYSGGSAQGNSVTGINNVVGSSFGDILVGNANINTIRGGDGNDTLAGGAGADTLDGGAGSDTADYSASATGVTINLATGVFSGGDAAGDSRYRLSTW